MDVKSVSRIAALLGQLPSKWTLARAAEEEEAKRAQRKWPWAQRQKAKRTHGQRLANRLIYKNHRRRAIRRISGVVAPGRRYERFRSLEAIQGHRRAICQFWGFPASAKGIAKAVGIPKRYLAADLKWLKDNGYLDRTGQGARIGAGGKPCAAVLWHRTSKPFEGYQPNPLKAAIYRNKAMTPEQREAALQAEIQAAIERQEGRAANMIVTRDGKPMAPASKRRRRLPQADYARIQANQKAKRAKRILGTRQA